MRHSSVFALAVGAAITLCASSAWAGGAEMPVPARLEAHARFEDGRRQAGLEGFAPLTWNGSLMSFADLRFSAGSDEGREFNAGLGLRRVFGESGFILGGYGFFDRRRSQTGNFYSQGTFGGEVLAEGWDVRANAYAPFTEPKRLWEIRQPLPASLALSGNQIVMTGGEAVATATERAMGGFDLEAGAKIPFLKGTFLEGSRAFAAGYRFWTDDAPAMTGMRFRAETARIGLLRFGVGWQTDNLRGGSGFAEARVSVPIGDISRLVFGGGESSASRGILDRLGTRIERDVDVVTKAARADVNDVRSAPLTSAATGANQKVYVVDNSAATGGDGTAENPFATLAAAQSAAAAHDIIYVKAGNGTTTGMNAGVTLAHEGQKLIGSGVPLAFDAAAMRMVIPGILFEGQTILPATSAPALTNASGNAVTVTGASVEVAGLKAQSASDNGIYVANANGANLHDVIASGNANDGIRVEANGAGVAASASIERATATGNRNGIRFYAQNNGSLTAKLERSAATGNSQHGVIVYDDSTTGSVDADLGGGSQGGVGLNTLRSNTLEDLALDTDGATLQAQNNWWGQAGGPLATQIYKGAPMDTGLVGNWTFDDGSGTTARDRSGNGNTGTLTNGPTWTTGQLGGALSFDGVNDYVGIANQNIFNILGDLTLIAFVNPNNLDTGRRGTIINRRLGYLMTINGNGDSFGYEGNNGTNWDNNYSSPGGTVALNVWQMLSVVFIHNTSVKLYHQGALINSKAVVGGHGAYGSCIVIGADICGGWGSPPYYSGLIDDVRIYNRALSASEVSELYRMDVTGTAATTGALSSAP